MRDDLIPYLERANFACVDVEYLVDDYVDGELDEVLRVRFDSHLDGCNACRGLVFDIQKLVELARTLDHDPIPVGISERLRNRLEEELGVKLSSPNKLFVVK
jgi:anti-sigma factor RsiW